MSAADRVVVRTVALDEAPDLLALLPDPSGLAWVRHGDGLVGWGEAARVDVSPGTGRFRHAAAALAELWADADVRDEVSVPGSGPVAFGAFTFDRRVPGSALVVPAVTVGRRGGRAWVTVAGRGRTPDVPGLGPVATGPPPDRIRYAGASMPELGWLEAVAEAIRRIDAGGLSKVVLARDHAVWSKAPFDARVLCTRLSKRFPECFTFVGGGLVGATPELLVSRTGRAVASTPLAGSAARGAEPAADAALGRALLASDKDRAEHAAAVASVRSALAPSCADLRVDAEPSLLRLDNVQHLATRVRGTLDTPGASTALELAGALHPTAAVCGAPTDVALATIRELEGMDRGCYAGPVGWVDARGDGEWAIALRCAELSGARARLFAGAGIVAGSLPEAELEETRIKLRAMQSAFEG